MSDKDKKELTLAERFPNNGEVIPRIEGAPTGTSGVMAAASFKQDDEIYDRSAAEGHSKAFRQAYMHGVPSQIVRQWSTHVPRKSAEPPKFRRND